MRIMRSAGDACVATRFIYEVDDQVATVKSQIRPSVHAPLEAVLPEQ